ncbi:hypothetical protein I4F81_007386 [Pyropia yezoensis]|uniref:Uncharacterized protein n=1 Tax=Pyropia yezoensis TaxID=2788 RepID=A0ACC3C4H5_PYRYE|nr:hypothetical protein I4F81_007386 [Neopyropia yezoensis]
MTAWERFQSYCTGAGLRSLPAHYTTVAGYVGCLHTGGRVSPDSMGSYLSPVDTVHELAGYPPPTAHPIFTRLRKGYLRLSAARARGMPLYTAPLPSDVIQQALALGTKYPTTEQRRAFHKSEGRMRSRSAFLVPVHPHGYRSDAPLRFLLAFHRHYLAAGGSPLAPIFAAVDDRPGPRVTSHRLRLVLGWLGASPPVGVRWSVKSLRSGAATAANAFGVSLAVVAAYMEHSQTAVTARSYIDARFLPTAAAWDFFGRYISDWSGIRRAIRKGCYASYCLQHASNCSTCCPLPSPPDTADRLAACGWRRAWVVLRLPVVARGLPVACTWRRLAGHTERATRPARVAG